MLSLFNEGAARTPPRAQEHSAPRSTSTPATTSTATPPTTMVSSQKMAATMPTTFSKPRSYSFGSPLTPPPGIELPLNLLDDDDEKEEKSDAKMADEIDSSLDPAATEELMNALKQLEQAPSADVKTREQIARFPPDVADLSKLKNIKSKEDADRFAVQLAHADMILTEYNARLSDELEKRRSTLARLQRFVEAHKRRIEDETKELETWKSKVARLSTDRQELLVHIQSLPDLSKLPDPTKLPPLPSAGDLFTN